MVVFGLLRVLWFDARRPFFRPVAYGQAMVDRIWEAIDRYAVLVFHDQHLDDEGLRNFAGSNCQFRARMCNGFQHPPRRADQGQKDGDSVAIAAS